MIAVVAIIVVGPKDLPRMLRTLGKTMGQLRRTANDFRRQFDDALKEAEQQADFEDTRKSLEGLGKIDPLADVKKELASVFFSTGSESGVSECSIVLAVSTSESSSTRPFLKLLMPLATSPMSSEILPRPKSRTTITPIMATCQIPIDMMKNLFSCGCVVPWRGLSQIAAAPSTFAVAAGLAGKNLAAGLAGKNQNVARIEPHPNTGSGQQFRICPPPCSQIGFLALNRHIEMVDLAKEMP